MMTRYTAHECGECLECARLLGKYEAATFEQAKIHNALGIAERSGDRTSTRRLTLDAYDVTSRQRNARAAFEQHRETCHRSVESGKAA